MTERLYYTDSLLRSFDAVVVSSDLIDGRAHVVLDRTAFYPTSGGQPFDTGRLDQAPVVDVIDRDDGVVVHVVAAPLAPGRTVRGDIDWPRRFDHMQQHTGQHILSAAFDRLCQARTTSFHMGAESSTIDLGREASAADIDAAEGEANRVVWDDLPVDVRFVSSEEARALPLRKAPAREGLLRLVQIGDFDLSACGGSHAPRTGVVGLIAVTAVERFKGGSRVQFVCGGRALASHRVLRETVGAAARALSAAPADLGRAIDRLRSEAHDLGRSAVRLNAELAAYRGAELRAAAETVGGRAVVIKADAAWDAPMLKLLASAVIADGPLIVALIGGGEPVPVVIARSPDMGEVDASALVRRVIAALGGRGGGRPELAQAGIPAPAADVLATIRLALAD